MALTVMKLHHEAWQIDDRKSPAWDYVHGLLLSAFEELYKKTHNEKYYNYIKQYADDLIDSSGAIKTYKLKDYNIDMIEPGKILFRLYNNTDDQNGKV